MGFINAWKGLFTPGELNPTVLPTPRRRMYGGAQTGRLLSDWVASATSADAEIKSSIKRLRQRSRQLIRDNAFARNAVRSITSNVIGPSGIKLQAQVRQQRGSKLNKKINDQIEMAWREWGRYDSAHTAGRLCFSDIEKLVCSSLCESGEVFVRIVRKPFGRSSIPFSLEILEADQLDDDYNGPARSKKNSWRMGIEHDGFGRPVQYAFLTAHPGDTPFPSQPGAKRHMLLPAADIIHLFIQERPGQTRGVPWTSSILKPLHQLDGFAESSLVRARASSALMGFITNQEGELDPGGEVYEEERVTSFEPGTFHYLNQNESVTVPDMDSPSGEFEPFMRAMLRQMAAGIGLSYTAISKDYSQSNYSSSRLALIEDREQFKSLQKYFIEVFHSRVFEAWIEMAVLSNNLDLPNYESDGDRYKRVKWVTKGQPWIDPLREVEALKDAVRCGFKTQREVLAEQGLDLDDVMTSLSEEREIAESYQLVLDIDPAKVSNAGLTHARPSGTQLPDP